MASYTVHMLARHSLLCNPSQDSEHLFRWRAQNQEYSISPPLNDGHTLRTLLGGVLARRRLRSCSARTRNILGMKGYPDYLKVEAGPTGLQCMQKLV